MNIQTTLDKVWMKMVSADNPQKKRLTNDLYRPETNLDKSRWPIVWAIGNQDILKQPLLGFFCSNKCTGDAILRTYDLARGLRDAGIPVISGFHSTMEKECLDLLLRGTQPIVICPARSIHNYRLKKPWVEGINEGRILILSPFEEKHTQPTARLAETRNHLVATLATKLFVSHAESGSKTERLCLHFLEQQKRILLLNSCKNHTLKEAGATCVAVEDVLRKLELTK